MLFLFSWKFASGSKNDQVTKDFWKCDMIWKMNFILGSWVLMFFVKTCFVVFFHCLYFRLGDENKIPVLQARGPPKLGWSVSWDFFF